jgi:hypothetical protein
MSHAELVLARLCLIRICHRTIPMELFRGLQRTRKFFVG